MTAQAGDKVAICTVASGQPNWAYANSVFTLRTPGEKIFRQVVGKQGIDNARNALIWWFLRTDYDWMLCLDSDAVLHPDTLLRLLSWDEPFVSALAFQRKPPFVPVVYKGQRARCQWTRQIEMTRTWLTQHPDLVQMGKPTVLAPRPDDALYAVDRGGMHCVLIHRDVFERTSYPWFERSGSASHTGAGEDFTFYKNVQEAGFTTWLDRSVIAGHLAQDICVGAADFLVWASVCTWTSDGQPIDITVESPKIDDIKE